MGQYFRHIANIILNVNAFLQHFWKKISQLYINIFSATFVIRPYVWIPSLINPKRSFCFLWSGLVMIVITAIVGVVAIHTSAGLLYLILGLLLGAWIVSVILSNANMWGISVTRSIGQTSQVGEFLEIIYTVTNRKILMSSYAVSIEEVIQAKIVMPHGSVMRIGPRKTMVIKVRMLCQHRGNLQLRSVRLASRYPFGLVAKSIVTTEAAGVMIHPHIGRIGFDLFSGQRASTSGGIGQYNQQTKGFEEYLGIREFRDTDSFHWVHWKSSARLNKLMVKEMAEYHANQITIILDLRIDVKNIKQRDALETAICFVATLIERATERSLPIALILRGHKIKTMRHGQGAGHRWSLMTELAIVEMAVIDDSDSGVGGIYPKSFRDAHRWIVGVGIIDRYSDVAGYRGSSSLIDVLEDKFSNIYSDERSLTAYLPYPHQRHQEGQLWI
jgi:uncharacterized protein (DUF58 family)